MNIHKFNDLHTNNVHAPSSTSTVTLMVVAVIQVLPATIPKMDTKRTLRFKTRWAEVLIFVMTQHDRLILARTVEKDG